MSYTRACRRWVPLFVAAVLGTLTGPARAECGRCQPAIDAARPLVEAFVTRGDAPGVSVAVFAEGQVAWSQGFGLSNVEDAVAVTPATRFRIGSISKTISASVAALLASQNRFDLDAPIQSYVPAFPRQALPITPRMLLTHLSGIRHYGRNDYIVTKRYDRLADALELFKDDPLVAPPGARFFYSTYGYTLLGAAIEAATGKPFAAAARDLVIEPFGMAATVPDSNLAILPRRAQPYQRGGDGQLQHSPYADLSSRLPGGGFLSTPEDLVRFAGALLTSTAVGAETRSMLFTPGRTSSGESTGYAMGWRIGKDAQGRTIYHHGGDALGGRAFLLVYPDARVIVALAANANIAFAEKEALQIAKGFLPP